MISETIDWIEEILGDRQFITARETVDFGIFGSMSGVRLLRAKGALPFIRISPRRFAIPRKELIQFLIENHERKRKGVK